MERAAFAGKREVSTSFEVGRVEWVDCSSARSIAAKLAEMGIAAPRGGAWTYKTVQRMMARLAHRSRPRDDVEKISV